MSMRKDWSSKEVRTPYTFTFGEIRRGGHKRGLSVSINGVVKFEYVSTHDVADGDYYKGTGGVPGFYTRLKDVIMEKFKFTANPIDTGFAASVVSDGYTFK